MHDTRILGRGLISATNGMPFFKYCHSFTPQSLYLFSLKYRDMANVENNIIITIV